MHRGIIGEHAAVDEMLSPRLADCGKARRRKEARRGGGRGEHIAQVEVRLVSPLWTAAEHERTVALESGNDQVRCRVRETRIAANPGELLLQRLLPGGEFGTPQPQAPPMGHEDLRRVVDVEVE